MWLIKIKSDKIIENRFLHQKTEQNQAKFSRKPVVKQACWRQTHLTALGMGGAKKYFRNFGIFFMNFIGKQVNGFLKGNFKMYDVADV